MTTLGKKRLCVYKFLVIVFGDFLPLDNKQLVSVMIELTSSATKGDENLISRAVRHETVIRSPGYCESHTMYRISSKKCLCEYCRIVFVQRKALYDCRFYCAVDSFKIAFAYIFSFLISLRKSLSTSIL